MSDFTARQIFNSYESGEIDKITAINYFRDIIENESSEDLRFETLEFLGMIEIKNNEIFKIFGKFTCFRFK